MVDCTFENGNKANLRHATVGCIVVKNGSILMAKRSKGLLEAGKWCIVGGYVDLNETTAQAAVRETLEETGWSVKNLQLLRLNDNPDRPNEDRQNIDFIYVADAVAEVGKKDWESESVKWFPLDKLPPAAKIAFDHYDSIQLYRRHLVQPVILPIVGAIPTE